MTRGRGPRRRTAVFAAWWRSAQWYVVALGAVAAFLLGVAGYAQGFERVGQQLSFADAIYLSLQLFTLESASVEPPLPLALEIARFLAPTVTVLGAATAATTLLGERLSQLRVRFARGHVVVCGLGERGQRIAEEFLAAGYRVAVIEREEHESRVAPVRAVGAAVLAGDAADEWVLRLARAHRARYVVAVCTDDGANAAISVNLSAMCAKRPPNRPVTAIVHVRNTQLCELLAQGAGLTCGEGALRLEFFNIPHAGAEAMLAEVPPGSRATATAPRIAVVGLDPLGQSLVLQAARSWWSSSATRAGKPSVVLVDAEAANAAALLRARAPRLDDACEVRAFDLAPDDLAFEQGTFLFDAEGLIAVDAVYVCLDDDAESLATALSVQRLTRAARVPIAVRMRSNAGLAALTRSGVGDFAHLHPVGVLDATCSLEALLDGVNESVARAVHADYVRRERDKGHTVADNPSMAAWAELPEDLRESNRRQADDIGEKLAAIGMVIVPLDDWALTPDTFSEEEIERLSVAEHERWVRERLSQGWLYAPGPKDIEHRTSPDLVPWEKISEEVRDLDRAAVRAIPALLMGAGLSTLRVGRAERPRNA